MKLISRQEQGIIFWYLFFDKDVKNLSVVKQDIKTDARTQLDAVLSLDDKGGEAVPVVKGVMGGMVFIR